MPCKSPENLDGQRARGELNLTLIRKKKLGDSTGGNQGWEREPRQIHLENCIELGETAWGERKPEGEV